MSLYAKHHPECPTCTCTNPLPEGFEPLATFQIDPYAELSKLAWIDVNDRPLPLFDKDKHKDNIDHNDFLAAWILNGAIQGIEWYTYLGDGEFWNQNSNNLNEFDDNHPLPIHHGPTHWLPVPRGKL